MRDISDAADLLATAREAMLAELLPLLPNERRYVGLMIANVLAIAAREQRLGFDAARHEAARLSKLLAGVGATFAPSRGPVEASDLTALRKAFCAAVRAGRFDAPENATTLAGELLHAASDWLAISNPKALRGVRATSNRA